MSTPKLDATDKKILTAALKSGQRRMTVPAIAKESGCTVETLCNRLKDPEFKQLFLETMQSSLFAETPEILAAFLDKAKDGSFKHGKLILEIAEVYSEKKKLDLDAKVKSEIQDPFTTDEEKKEFLKATLAKYSEEGE